MIKSVADSYEKIMICASPRTHFLCGCAVLGVGCFLLPVIGPLSYGFRCYGKQWTKHPGVETSWLQSKTI